MAKNRFIFREEHLSRDVRDRLKVRVASGTKYAQALHDELLVCIDINDKLPLEYLFNLEQRKPARNRDKNIDALALDYHLNGKPTKTFSSRIVKSLKSKVLDEFERKGITKPPKRDVVDAYWDAIDLYIKTNNLSITYLRPPSLNSLFEGI